MGNAVPSRHKGFAVATQQAELMGSPLHAAARHMEWPETCNMQTSHPAAWLSVVNDSRTLLWLALVKMSTSCGALLLSISLTAPPTT